MTDLVQWRLRCDTDSIYEYVWLEDEESPPTTCPTDTAHTVSGAAVEVGRVASDQVHIVNDDNTTVHFPLTSAKTPIFQPSVVPPGYLLYVTGAFDLVRPEATKSVATINGEGAVTPYTCYKVSDAGTLTLGSLAVVADDIVLFEFQEWKIITLGDRAKGKAFALRQDGPGESKVDGHFLEHVYVLGGIVSEHVNAGLHDWIEMEVEFPASVPTSTPGAGNANKVSTGLGFNILVPAPLNDGDWTVDGATLEIGEINKDLVPIPNDSGTGMWNWDPDASPSITPVANPGAPDGDYDLFDAPFGAQVRQANRLPLRYMGEITPDTLKGKKLLPHWILRFKVGRNEASGACEGSAIMQVARKKTV